MTILISVLVYIGVVAGLLTFLRFVHRCDDVMRTLHANLPSTDDNIGSPIAHNRAV